MNPSSWQAFYYDDLQSPWALLVVPFAFLVYRWLAPADPRRAIVPEATGFVSALTLVFAFETMLDPIVTGPLLRLEGLRDGLASTAIPFLFVYLGDLRVLLLLIGIARPGRRLVENLRWALRLALVVPVSAGAGFGVLWFFSEDPSQKILWMLYELGFLVLCIWLARRWLPAQREIDEQARGYGRAVLGYSAAYYALWLAADLVIVVLGLDLGWALRIVPNQLYYAVWVPFVYWRFFSGPPVHADRKTASSRSTQISR
jgi:hypothetical protein